MNFKLIVDKSKEEEIVATVHKSYFFLEKVEKLVLQHNGTDKLTAYMEDEIRMLPISQVECIAVIEGKTYAISSDGVKYQLKQRLYELEERLPSFFFRINKSAIANENRLEKFSATYSGGVNAVFKSGYTEYVSRRCFATIKRRFDTK